MRPIDLSIPKILPLLVAATALVAILAVFRDFSFFPNRVSDGFFEQIEYVRGLIANDQWSVLLSDPLTVVHLVRFSLVSPFLAAETLFGPAASVTMLCLLLWPLLIAFTTNDNNGWKSVLFAALRLSILMLPLLVSGRTVLVAAGMGYLVVGVLVRPYSGWKMLIGVLLGTLSSGSLFLSLAVLFLVGNNKSRSAAFYKWKICMVLVIMLIIAPSIFAKFYGFTNGASGYEISDNDVLLGAPENDAQRIPTNIFEGDGEQIIGAVGGGSQGPVAAIQRLLVRSTVVQSYLTGNYARLALYALLWGAAAWYVIGALVDRHWHSMLVVLLILSTGVLVEGLSVWPLLFPVIWVFSGYVVEKRESSTVEWRI